MINSLKSCVVTMLVALAAGIVVFVLQAIGIIGVVEGIGFIFFTLFPSLVVLLAFLLNTIFQGRRTGARCCKILAIVGALGTLLTGVYLALVGIGASVAYQIGIALATLFILLELGGIGCFLLGSRHYDYER